MAEKLSTGDTFYLCDNANRFVVSKGVTRYGRVLFKKQEESRKRGGEDAAGRELAAVFHLTADGEMKELHEFPALSEGEGGAGVCR